jgi:hypothetical protein
VGGGSHVEWEFGVHIEDSKKFEKAHRNSVLYLNEVKSEYEGERVHERFKVEQKRWC